MHHLISVIIPIYNSELYLEKCLSSVVNQTYSNLEIILVNDGSIDSSLSICENFRNRDNRIHLITQKNMGLSSARNIGLASAKGDFISFIDSDDWIDINFYSEMTEFAYIENVDIVMCGAKVFNNEIFLENRFIYSDKNAVIEKEKCIRDILLDKIGSQVWCKIAKRGLWNNIEFPIGRLYEDIPTTYKIFINCTTKIGLLASPMYNYILHESSISSSKNPIKKYHIFLGFKERFEFVVKSNLDIKNDCLLLTMEFAFAALKELYCADEKYDSHIEADLYDFIKPNLVKALLKSKNSILKSLYYLTILINKKLFMKITKMRYRQLIKQ